jgi:hypothetical protein
MTRKGDLKSRFISNALSKGMNKKNAQVAWNTEKNNLGVTVNNLSLESIGQPSKNVFSIAAFNKEEKETQRDLNLAGVKKPETKVVDVPEVSKTTITKVVNRPEIPPPSPIELAETEELDIASYITEEQKEVIRGAPSKSGIYPLATPNAEVGSDKQVDMSIMTALHGELKSQQQVEIEIAESKGEPAEPEKKVEPKPVQAEKVSIQTETAVTSAAKAHVKVGDVYQVQTQGNVNVTEEQRATFFNKLSSKYPGEMGNLKADVKDKDFVQIIPPKKYKKKGK